METYGLPEQMAKKLTSQQREVLEGYSTKAKRASVIRWRQRMAKAGIKGLQIAEETGEYLPRISEWIHFKKEPSQDKFEAVEAAIYKLGG